MLKPEKSPCRECPFGRKSLKGYLGGSTVEQFAATAHHAVVPLPCHMKVDYEDPNWQKSLPRVPQCAGHAVYLSNTCKQPRTPEVRTLPADRETVFSMPQEFVEHHGGDIVKFMELLNGFKMSPADAKKARAENRKFLKRCKQVLNRA